MTSNPSALQTGTGGAQVASSPDGAVPDMDDQAAGSGLGGAVKYGAHEAQQQTRKSKWRYVTRNPVGKEARRGRAKGSARRAAVGAISTMQDLLRRRIYVSDHRKQELLAAVERAEADRASLSRRSILYEVLQDGINERMARTGDAAAPASAEGTASATKLGVLSAGSKRLQDAADNDQRPLHRAASQQGTTSTTRDAAVKGAANGASSDAPANGASAQKSWWNPWAKAQPKADQSPTTSQKDKKDQKQNPGAPHLQREREDIEFALLSDKQRSDLAAHRDSLASEGHELPPPPRKLRLLLLNVDEDAEQLAKLTLNDLFDIRALHTPVGNYRALMKTASAHCDFRRSEGELGAMLARTRPDAPSANASTSGAATDTSVATTADDNDNMPLLGSAAARSSTQPRLDEGAESDSDASSFSVDLGMPIDAPVSSTGSGMMRSVALPRGGSVAAAAPDMSNAANMSAKQPSTALSRAKDAVGLGPEDIPELSQVVVIGVSEAVTEWEKAVVAVHFLSNRIVVLYCPPQRSDDQQAGPPCACSASPCEHTAARNGAAMAEAPGAVGCAIDKNASGSAAQAVNNQDGAPLRGKAGWETFMHSTWPVLTTVDDIIEYAVENVPRTLSLRMVVFDDVYARVKPLGKVNYALHAAKRMPFAFIPGGVTAVNFAGLLKIIGQIMNRAGMFSDAEVRKLSIQAGALTAATEQVLDISADVMQTLTVGSIVASLSSVVATEGLIAGLSALSAFDFFLLGGVSVFTGIVAAVAAGLSRPALVATLAALIAQLQTLWVTFPGIRRDKEVPPEGQRAVVVRMKSSLRSSTTSSQTEHAAQSAIEDVRTSESWQESESGESASGQPGAALQEAQAGEASVYEMFMTAASNEFLEEGEALAAMYTERVRQEQAVAES